MSALPPTDDTIERRAPQSERDAAPASLAGSTRRWWILASVSLTQLLIVLDSTIINVALPRAQADLGLSDAGRQWVITAYALSFGALLLLGGRVADFWGRRRTYLVGLAVFGAASAWGGLAHNEAEMFAARGLQGMAAAFMAPAALAFVTLAFPDGRERNRAFAVFGSLAGAGSALGMLLGGVLTEFLSWRWCLLVNVPFVLVGLVAGVRLLPESAAEGDRRYDLAGAATATLGFGAVVYALTRAEASWTSPITLGSLVGGLALIGAFVLVEHRSANPLLPLRVLLDRARATAFLSQGLIGAVGVGAMVYLTFHLQLVLGMGPLAAGAGTLPFTVSLMGTVPTSVRMLDRLGPRRQMVLGPLVSAAGLVWLGSAGVHGTYWVGVLPGTVLMGVGMGLAVVPLNNLALLGVAAHDAGVASATVTATQQLGGAVGLAVLTAVYAGVAGPGVDAGSAGMVAGNAAVFWGGAVIFAAAALVPALLLTRSRERLPA